VSELRRMETRPNRMRRWWLAPLSVAFAGSLQLFWAVGADAEQSGLKFTPGRCYARLLPKSYRRV
jgi:hypothetical protein